MKRQLNYTLDDIEELAAIAGPIFQDYWKGTFPENVQMELLIEEVFASFFSLSFALEKVDASLQDLYARVINAHSGLQHLWQHRRTECNSEEVRAFQEELAKVEQSRKSGVFVDSEGRIPRGQAMLTTMLEKSYRLARLLLVEIEAFEGVDPRLKAIYAKLQGVHSALVGYTESKYTLDQIQAQQNELASISQQVQDGAFRDASGAVPAGQAILMKLLDSDYQLVHHLLSQIA